MPVETVGSWAKILAEKLRPCCKLEVVSDCTGFNTIGELLSQLAPSVTYEFLSGSETDPQIRKLLVETGLKVCESMESRNFHDLPPRRGLRLYICGPPCQPFTPRNVKRKRWQDPRSTCVTQSLHNLKSSDADCGLIENSQHLRTQMQLVFPKASSFLAVLINYFKLCKSRNVLLDERSYVQDEVDKLKESYFTHIRVLDPAKYGFLCRRPRTCPGSECVT